MSDLNLRSLERLALSGDKDAARKLVTHLQREGDEDGAILANAKFFGVFKLRHDYMVDDLKVMFCNYDRKSRREKTSVVFSSNQPEPDMERPPYGGQRGDGSELSRLWKVFNRLELVNMRAQVIRGLGLVGIELPGKTAAKQLPWNAYAGCSTCRCSGGFTPPALHVRLNEDSDYKTRVDLYVTRIKTPEELAEEAAYYEGLKEAVPV